MRSRSSAARSGSAMINVDLYWYFLLPLILSIATIFVVRKLVPETLALGQLVGLTSGGLAISMGVMALAFYAGAGSQTRDTEIWNGEVTGKTRVHGHYLRSYQCNCHTSCSGSGSSRSCTTHCQTCYEDRYTVKWDCQTNIGGFAILHLDRGSKRVYNEPDPQRYTIINRGDPVSSRNGYTNYIKAVPASLFRPISEEAKKKYAASIPKYPADIYDIYRVDRVLPVGLAIPNLREWNQQLSEVLKTLGPQRQANAVIVVTKFPTDEYFFALRDAWNNGKKNDIVVVIGAPDFPAKAAWVRVMALTKDEIFQVRLRDRILALPTLTATGVTQSIHAEGLMSFRRKSMKDFKYLEAEIDPPTWVMVLACILIAGAYIGFWVVTFVNRDSQDAFNRFGMPHMPRRPMRRY